MSRTSSGKSHQCAVLSFHFISDGNDRIISVQLLAQMYEHTHTTLQDAMLRKVVVGLSFGVSIPCMGNFHFLHGRPTLNSSIRVLLVTHSGLSPHTRTCLLGGPSSQFPRPSKEARDCELEWSSLPHSEWKFSAYQSTTKKF